LRRSAVEWESSGSTVVPDPKPYSSDAQACGLSAVAAAKGRVSHPRESPREVGMIGDSPGNMDNYFQGYKSSCLALS
jgi:hypothetical protein